MKTSFRKAIRRSGALGLALLLTAVMTGCAASSETSDTVNTVQESSTEATAETEQVTTATKSTQEVSAKSEGVDKEETVYVLTDAAGETSQVIVSDHLRNPSGADVLQDASNLTDIENVKGNEAYTGSGNSMNWKANGAEIYYRGNSDSELPLEVSVEYELDGKKVTPEELAGKSGKVSMTFTYPIHKTLTLTEEDGKEVTVPLPFMAITGMVLENDKFSNVEVSNGKVLDDGDRTMVVGLALPGLSEALGLDEEKTEEDGEKVLSLDFDIPEKVTVTADVKDFSLDTTLTLAASDLLSDLDADDIDSLDDLSEALEKLTDASTQLVEGSNELYDGICTLYDKSAELISGVEELNDGAKQLLDGTQSLKDGTEQLKDGASELYSGADQLNGGAWTLSEGLGTLSGSSSELVSGARQIVDAVFDSATEQIKAQGVTLPTDLTLENYADVLGQVSDAVTSTVTEDAVRQALSEKGLSDASTQNLAVYMASDLKTDGETMEAAVVRAGTKLQNAATVQNYSGTASSLSEQENAVVSALAGQLAQNGTDASTAKLVALLAYRLNPSDPASAVQTAATMAADAAYVQQAQTNMTQDASAESTVASGISQIIEEEKTAVGGQFSEVLEQLNGVKKFYNGLQTYTAGVSSAKAGADQLASGAQQLKSGAGTLSNGTVTLDEGAQELLEGVTELKEGTQKLTDGGKTLREGVGQLKDGAKELRDGMEEFDQEGIQKITDLFEGDLQNALDRLHSVADGANAYNNFSGIASGASGKVKFIFKTAEIGD